MENKTMKTCEEFDKLPIKEKIENTEYNIFLLRQEIGDMRQELRNEILILKSLEDAKGNMGK